MGGSCEVRVCKRCGSHLGGAPATGRRAAEASLHCKPLVAPAAASPSPPGCCKSSCPATHWSHAPLPPLPAPRHLRTARGGRCSGPRCSGWLQAGRQAGWPAGQERLRICAGRRQSRRSSAAPTAVRGMKLAALAAAPCTCAVWVGQQLKEQGRRQRQARLAGEEEAEARALAKLQRDVALRPAVRRQRRWWLRQGAAALAAGPWRR